MSNLALPNVTDYATASDYLGGKPSRRLGYQTMIRRDDDGIVVTHHWTDIITYRPDGTIILAADGWVTATTANRLHKLTPRRVTVGRRLGEYRVTIDGETTTWDGSSPLHV